MKNPWIATIGQVKLFLQIEGSDYDALIATYLPVVSKDVATITNNQFIRKLTGDLTNGSASISNIDIELIDYGNVVMTEDLEQVAVVEIDDGANEITLSTEATQDLTETDIFINVFPTSKKPIAAAMVLYNIRKYSVSAALDGPLKSETVGSYSWTAANDGKGAAGYPQWIVDALKEITIPRFY